MTEMVMCREAILNGKNIRVILLLFFVSMFLTSCGVIHQKEDTVVDLTKESQIESPIQEFKLDYQFPDSVELVFSSLEPTELALEDVRESWEFIKSIPFGVVAGDSVTLSVYKETDSNHLCSFDYERIVLLEHKGKSYAYNDCFSTSIVDTEQSAEHRSIYLLEHEYSHQDLSFVLQGAVELSANGPGRMLFFYYDASQQKWYGFEQWGSPYLIDLDGDGSIELVHQFEGLHLNFPDVTIYRWANNGLEVSDSIKSILQVPHFQLSSALLSEENNQSILQLNAVIDNDFERGLRAKYMYQEGRIIRID